MFAPARRRCLQSAFSVSSPQSVSIPAFLVPAFSQPAQPSTSRPHRPFSTSSPCRSKIGMAPLSIPPEVTLTIIPPPARKGGRTLRKEPKPTIEIKGPLGQLSMEIPPYITIEEKERQRILKVQDAEERKQREMWGTTRAYLNNHILGVSEGHTAILRLVGVGYRATIENTATTVRPEFERQKFVNLKVGYSHPVELGIPEGVKASTPQPTRILLEGVEKEKVMQFAAQIRMWRKPEPYKGKGIFVNGETIKLKNKKIK